ncbi:MAG: hypothetical protein KAW09_08140, partial [Thermoplasmata archaeon]|nr:hypothetical protein [Thermoplasmata archaeon]
EVFTRFQNALTPEQETIKAILKENAEEVAGGKWQIRPFVHEIEEKHEEMVYYLGVLGRKCGFSVDIARDEYGKTYDGKQLSASLELAPLKYGDLTKNQRRRAERIDVVWHDGQKVRAEFEVEHSTSIVDAIVRGSNIKGADIERVLVIPNQREDLVSRRFKEPAMKSIMAKTEWRIITYKALGSFWKQSKSAKRIDPKTFFSLARNPLSSKEKDKREQQKLI